MSSIAGRSNTNERGNSYDRRARRAWLLHPDSGHGGDGQTVPCWECRAPVCARTMVVDRIASGEGGGRYTRANIRPHCAPCSGREGQRRTFALAHERRASTDRRWLDTEGRYAGPMAIGPVPDDWPIAPGWEPSARAVALIEALGATNGERDGAQSI